MSILERFFGRKEKNSSNIQGVLVANAEVDNPLSLVVVFDTLPENNSKELTRLLRNYHSSMKQATCELVPELDFFGLAGWGKHVISMVGFKNALPSGINRTMRRASSLSPGSKRASTGNQCKYYFIL